MNLKATVGGQRQRRGDGPRIREDDAAQGRVGGIASGDEIAKCPVMRVEEIIHETIDLDVVVDVIGCVDVDLGVPAKLFVQVGLVALEVLTGHGNEIGTKLPLLGQPIVKTGLEGVGGDARKVVAWRDKFAKNSHPPEYLRDIPSLAD